MGGDSDVQEIVNTVEEEVLQNLKENIRQTFQTSDDFENAIKQAERSSDGESFTIRLGAARSSTRFPQSTKSAKSSIQPCPRIARSLSVSSCQRCQVSPAKNVT